MKHLLKNKCMKDWCGGTVHFKGLTAFDLNAHYECDGKCKGSQFKTDLTEEERQYLKKLNLNSI